MLKEIYYLEGNKQEGPVSIDQLKSVGLKPNTLVWTAGLDKWKPACEVEELRTLLMPPLPASLTSKRLFTEDEKKESNVMVQTLVDEIEKKQRKISFQKTFGLLPSIAIVIIAIFQFFFVTDGILVRPFYNNLNNRYIFLGVLIINSSL